MTLFALVRLDVDCVDYTKRCIVLSCFFGLPAPLGRARALRRLLEAQGPCRGRNPEGAPAGQLDHRAARRTAAEHLAIQEIHCEFDRVIDRGDCCVGRGEYQGLNRVSLTNDLWPGFSSLFAVSYHFELAFVAQLDARQSGPSCPVCKYTA
jgi:hypothetical protein